MQNSNVVGYTLQSFTLQSGIIDASAVEASAKFWRGASYKLGGGTGRRVGSVV